MIKEQLDLSFKRKEITEYTFEIGQYASVDGSTFVLVRKESPTNPPKPDEIDLPDPLEGEIT